MRTDKCERPGCANQVVMEQLVTGAPSRFYCHEHWPHKDGGNARCPDCAGTGWIPPEMTEEHPSQSACMRCAAPKRDMPAWDTFAAAALTGIIAGDASGDSADVCVQWAATMADAMMAERAKR